MSCNLIYGLDNKLEKVVADNNQPSLLYKEALKQFGADQALDIYLTSKSDDFQDNIILSQNELDVNNEPKLKIVLNYLSLQNESKEPLTTQQKLDLRNISLGVENFSVQKLLNTFYADGIFNVSPKNLKKSGLYSDYEISNLANDTNLQEKVKQSLEALKNTEEVDITTEFAEQVEKTDEVNSFGKLVSLNPYIVQKEVLNKLAATTEEEFENSLADLEYPNFQKKLEKPVNKTLIQKVVDQLKKNTLANNVFVYTNTQIEQKLKELGVDVSRQMLEGQRIADKLPLTLSVFDNKSFVEMRGKQVNPITVLNQLNQTGIKQIEKDLIKNIIEQNYSGQKEVESKNNVITLYHRSDAVFDKFKLSNIGNRSKIQLSGWGMYFTNNESSLENPNSIEMYGKNLYKVQFKSNKETLLDFQKPVKKETVNKIVKALYNKNNKSFDENKFNLYYEYSKDKSLPQVEFNDFELIEFDYSGFLFYKALSRQLGGDKEASLFLLNNGIDGLKREISKTSTDYVIFNENSIEKINKLPQKTENNKISYDELEATVRANIMPLERITTSSYADDGMDNLGNGDYGNAKTLILNAPIEHGVTGHFSGDFKASGRKNIKYTPKQLNDNTWVAVEEGYEQQGANQNNIYQFVGTAGTKEAVNSWIENYEATQKEWIVYEDIFYDTKDYNNSIKFLASFNTEQEAQEWLKKNEKKYENSLDYNSKSNMLPNINKGMFAHMRVWQDGDIFSAVELQSDYFQKQYVVEDLTQQTINSKEHSFTQEQKDLYNSIFKDLISYREVLFEYRDSLIKKYGKKLEGISKQEKEVLDNYKKTYEEKKEQYEKEVVTKARPLFSKQEKQFIASQKEWEKRLLREALKEASLSGATTFRLPTPYTLSVIEGYVKGEETNGRMPYTIVRGNPNFLNIGDLISMDGNTFMIVDTNYEEIRVVEESKIRKEDTDENWNKDLAFQNEDPTIDGKIVFIYYKQSDVETLNNPSFYEGSEGVNKEAFEISDLSDVQQTVARKYEELYNLLQQERGAENVETITDENGFDWYETKISKEERNKPVVAFQKDFTLTPSGFVYREDVYLNEDKMKLDTPVHEFGHLYLNWLKSNKGDIYQRGLQLAQSKDAQEYIDYVERTQPQLTGEAKLNEILSQAIGDNGAKLADKSWIEDLWDEIKKLFGLSQYTNEQVQNMNLKQFTKAIAVDLYKNQLFQEMQGYKKAEVFMEVDGEIVQAKNTNTAVILPLVAKQIDDIEDINKLQQYDLEILQANQEDTVKILKGIETDLIAQGIDVAGLADKEINAELMSFLGELEVFINNPTVENTKAFADVYDAYFEKDLSPKTEIIKAQETDRDFVKLNTNLSEEQVYEQQGLIKVKDGLYIRTNKQDLDTLYSSLETYTEKYPKDTNLKEYVQTQIATLEDFKNSDNAEAVYLYKMYFDIATTNEKEAVKTNANFTGNYEYLTTEFVSDFYIEMLKEREKNSEIYKNFYSNFDINENGIYLKNEDNITMSQVKEYADENLKQYSIVSKQIPLLTEQEIQSETKQVRRDTILNSPQNLEKYQGQYHKLNDNNLILKNSGEEFIKVGGNIFEAVDTDGNLTLYSRLNSVVGEYYTFENEAPKTNVKIEDYSYLNTQPEKFLTEKSYLSKSAKEKINRENFDCI